MRDSRGVRKKFPSKCWARARCPNPLEVKVGSGALLGPKHTGLGRDNPSPQKCWGCMPNTLGGGQHA